MLIESSQVLTFVMSTTKSLFNSYIMNMRIKLLITVAAQNQTHYAITFSFLEKMKNCVFMSTMKKKFYDTIFKNEFFHLQLRKDAKLGVFSSDVTIHF